MSFSKLFEQNELMAEVLEFVPVGKDLFHCILSNKSVYSLIHQLHNQFKLDQILFKPWFWFCKPLSVVSKSKSKEEDRQLLVKPFYPKPCLPNKSFLQRNAKYLTHEHCLDPFFTYIRLLSLDQKSNTLYSETEQELLFILLVHCSWNVLSVQYCKLALIEKIGLQVRTLITKLSSAMQSNSTEKVNELITEGCNTFYPFANLQNNYLYSHFYKLRNMILKKQGKNAFVELPKPIAIMVLLNPFCDISQVLTEEQKQDEEIAFWAVKIKSERLIQYQQYPSIIKNRQIALIAMNDTTINGKDKVIPIDDEFKIDKRFWLQVIRTNAMALKLVLQIPELYNKKDSSFVRRLVLQQPCALETISEEKAKEILQSDKQFMAKIIELYPPALRFTKDLTSFREAVAVLAYNPAYLANIGRSYDSKGHRRVFHVSVSEFREYALQHPEIMAYGNYMESKEIQEMYKNDVELYKQILQKDPISAFYSFNTRSTVSDLKLFEEILNEKYGKNPSKVYPMQMDDFYTTRPKQFGLAVNNRNNRYKYLNFDIHGYLENLKWLDPTSFWYIFGQSYQTTKKCTSADWFTFVKAYPFILALQEQWKSKLDASEQDLKKGLQIALDRCPAVEKLIPMQEWIALEKHIQ